MYLTSPLRKLLMSSEKRKVSAENLRCAKALLDAIVEIVKITPYSWYQVGKMIDGVGNDRYSNSSIYTTENAIRIRCSDGPNDEWNSIHFDFFRLFKVLSAYTDINISKEESEKIINALGSCSYGSFNFVDSAHTRRAYKELFLKFHKKVSSMTRSKTVHRCTQNTETVVNALKLIVEIASQQKPTKRSEDDSN